MQVRNIQMVIFLMILLLFANHVWAEEWVLYEKSQTGNRYYDKSSIKEVNNIASVWTIKVYNQEGKAKDFAMLKRKNKAPQNADILNCNSVLVDFDCKNNTFKVNGWTIYDKEKKAVYSVPKYMSQWKGVGEKSSSGKLKNIVCKKR